MNAQYALYTTSSSPPPSSGVYGHNATSPTPDVAKSSCNTTTATTIPSCSMTADILEEHLQRANYGENKALYRCYFMEGMPPRCVTCGESIGAHPRTVMATVVDPPLPPPRVTTHATPQHGAVQRVGGRSVPVTRVRQPECSFCKNLSVGNPEAYRESINGYDETPLTMQLIPFNDDMAMRTGQYFSVECDECRTEFPVRTFPSVTRATKHHPIPLASEEEQDEIRTFFAQYPELQCYACKYCKRKVCSDCIKNNLHEGPNSRFNSRENEWKTSLFGCCGSPKHTINALFCYYFCMHNSSVYEFEPVFTRGDAQSMAQTLETDLCIHVVMFPFHVIFSPVAAIVSELLYCSSLRALCALETKLQRRYGLPSHSTATLLFCRYCAFIRIIREVEERGYPQHTCCTRPGDVDGMVSQYPAPHPLAVKKEIQAPPSSAAMYYRE